MSNWKDFKNNARDDRAAKSAAPVNWNRRIETLTREGRHREAAEMLKALPSEKLSDELKGLLARAYNNCGEYARALDLLLTTEDYGKDIDVWNYRVGYSYYFLGDYEKSRQYFSRAAELDPDDLDAKWFVAQCDLHRPFATRVREFWQWFERHDERLRDLLGQNGDHGAEITRLLNEGMNLLGDEMYYNIGGNNELTFCVENRTECFHLYPWLVAQAPGQVRRNWSIFPCKQPADTSGFTFRMYDRNIDIANVRVHATYDAQSGTFDLLYHHPALTAMTDGESLNAFYIMLEITIGEGTAYNYIREVKATETPSEDFMQLNKLAAHIKATREADKKPFNTAPELGYSAYEHQPEKGGLRADIVCGNTKCIALCRDFDDKNADLYLRFTRRGVEAAFLTIIYRYPDLENPGGASLDMRHRAEDRLEALFADGTLQGEVLGGAMGAHSRAYIDVLLYDSPAFVKYFSDQSHMEELLRDDNGTSPDADVWFMGFIDAQYAQHLYKYRPNN